MHGYDSAMGSRSEDDLDRWRFAADVVEVVVTTPPEWSARIRGFYSCRRALARTPKQFACLWKKMLTIMVIKDDVALKGDHPDNAAHENSA